MPMDKNQASDETTNVDAAVNKNTATVSRPTTLNILLNNTIKNPLLPSFPTPSFEDIQPILKSEVEKILQHLSASPQTPGSFLNPKHVTEEQERFANVFTQKLNELQDPAGLASLTAALSPAVSTVTNNRLYNVSLTDINPQGLPNFAELCRQASQAGINASPASILFYSPNCIDNQSLQSVSNGLIALHSSQIENQNQNSDTSAHLNKLQSSISLPISNVSHSTEGEMATLQLPNGLRLGISTTPSHPSVFQMLGIETRPESIPEAPIAATTLDSSVWPASIQANLNYGDITLNDGQRGLLINSPVNDTRPSSVENSIDQTDHTRPLRSSSVSSVSSSSQANSSTKVVVRQSNVKDARLDPTEQSRMRLERKRARNRDAARKCRERKIRLIKSLEKDVFHLSEENKALRNRLSHSRVEVERLKMFVVNHLEKECPALSGKVA